MTSQSRSQSRELYLVTDIDGTVVPHPYHSGLSQEERNPYIKKLLDLMRNHHVACVTGRTMAGWQRLWREAEIEPHLPRLMGLSFGADIYEHGKHVDVRKPSRELSEVVTELRNALEGEPAFRQQADTRDVMLRGRLQGYYFEEKTHIVQLDWNFATEAMNLRFAEHVFHVLNPHLAKAASLRCQVFHRRIDILANGFVPKAELASHVTEWVHNTRLAQVVPSRVTNKRNSHTASLHAEGHPLDPKPECLVLGDELYDDYLFESMRSMVPRVFHRVTCIGVDNGIGTRFRHAHRTVLGPDGAWAAIAEWLA
ncbi:MAG: hypothetical protein ACO3X1_13720 [Burkholderiaceae bacterium]